MAKIDIGTLPFDKGFVGESPIDKIYVGESLVYQKTVPVVSHNVSIVITSESDSYHAKEYFRVYDGTDTSGTLLVNSTSYPTTTPMNVVCSTGHLYIELGGDGSLWYVHTPTATSGITLDTSHFDESNPSYNDTNYYAYIIADVGEDGTITFSYIKWED